MTRIICIGNRFVAEDEAGSRVYDWLSQQTLPREMEVIEGGLAGLNLARFIEGATRIIFVDAIKGSSSQPAIHILDPTDVAEQAGNGYDHSAGLAYLLKVLPIICEEPLPTIQIIGLVGMIDDQLAAEAGRLILKLAKSNDLHFQSADHLA